MSSRPVIEKLKQLDAYPKTLDDYRIRTYAGGTVTIISYIIMTLLFLSELSKYLTPEVTEEIFVDTSRTPKLQIALNITMPHIPCTYLSLDAMDSSGEQHLQIDHDVYKIPIDIEGRPIASPLKEDVGAPPTKANSTAIAVPKCGSCYGAESADLNITCCNTCSDVRGAYLKRRWQFPDPESIEQCKGGKDDMALPKEGCNIYGRMEVNRVGGSFHIAPGQSFSINHVHVHDVQPFSSSVFNTSHRIEHLSFGYNIPGKTNPLDGTIGIATDDGSMFQYYLKIVPLVYHVVPDTEHLVLTNQFSVTRHQKAEGGHSSLPPGVFFSYELAPLVVKYTEKKRSFGHFVTNVCAIIGGVFTVASIIDSVLYKSIEALQHKIEIGKVY